ncbi:MAG: hypothetical protein NC388_01395 [Clostridium sp.]|nr:hypothetical protein [Clostridium sp.]
MIHTLHYTLHEVQDYINWIYFFHAWGFPPRFASIARIHGCDACRAGWLAGFPEEERPRAEAAMQLHKEALRMLRMLDRDFETHARFGLFDTVADGDDLLVSLSPHSTVRLPLLRQQRSIRPADPLICLSDFVRPASQGKTDTIGIFAATVDAAMERLYTEGQHADDYRHMLAQTLADRLAEATTEKMHEEVRRSYWGYAPDERLTIDDLLAERYQGIRPAVGYPSLPDQSMNFDLDRLIDFGTIGIRLTENGAMQPHASVSGLMLAHPAARYFAVGKIGEDQLLDYARRKGLTPQRARQYLTANLSLTPHSS